MPDAWPRGVRVAVDPGRARIGVARSDPEGRLALPHATIEVGGGGRPTRRARADAIVELAGVVADLAACYVVVGLPLTLAGEEGPAAREAREFAEALARSVACPVCLLDERLSTREAARGLRDAGRDSRASRAIVDQAAAVVVLEHALAIERAEGTPPGRRVTVVDVDTDAGGRDA